MRMASPPPPTYTVPALKGCRIYKESLRWLPDQGFKVGQCNMCTMYIYKLWGLPGTCQSQTTSKNHCVLLLSQLAGMQILFVPERHHWVLSSCVKGNVALYDSASACKLPPRLPANPAGSAVQCSDTPQNQRATGGVHTCSTAGRAIRL